MRPVASVSFDDLLRAHQGMIRAFLRRLCRNDALADDLAQDAFLIAHQRLGDLRDTGAAKSWLFQIAYNVYAGHARKHARRRELFEAQNGADLDDAAQPAPAGMARDIAMAMDQLPADVRACVLMCLSYGMSHSEASKASGLPLGTVKSHIKRGTEKLRAFLHAYQQA
ncbi:RNA polymerase sigma factor [Robiginitomaculum antarcticum]|uniref:RNA polymerase sigma factor n=1 Tax=Robiginitomaculum antarcticum TaxID=437507 RepID=UPI00037E3276|nr:RNA polymerase sigma factor [Robiginitomaculum antarcticum]